ncbi:MAG: DUF481 domain-containing protein [Halioglobus sp.]|nr:DUF481 domain-containing protein [Halioglobus sp.]
MKNLLTRLLLALALSACPALAQTALDEVTLINGSRILGTVMGARDGVLTVATDFAGTLSIAADQVASVTTNTAVSLLMADNAVIENVPLTVREGQLLVASEPRYALTDLKVVNPAPWELGEGYNWTGIAEAGWVMQRGNTDTDELNYKLESTWLSTRDRYTLKWYGENDEVNGQKSADNWQLTGKYDYFLDDPNYWGMQVALEEDKFADLELRTLIGPYIGRQFFAAPVFTFSGEVGLSYVEEDFFEADDQEYAAATWALKATSDVLGGDSRLYFDQTGIWSLDDTSDLIVKSIFGLGFPLMWNFEAAAEVQLEYDSGIVREKEELDQTYRFRVGYSW